jgi:hypothetical protein
MHSSRKRKTLNWPIATSECSGPQKWALSQEQESASVLLPVRSSIHVAFRFLCSDPGNQSTGLMLKPLHHLANATSCFQPHNLGCPANRQMMSDEVSQPCTVDGHWRTDSWHVWLS